MFFQMAFCFTWIYIYRLYDRPSFEKKLYHQQSSGKLNIYVIYHVFTIIQIKVKRWQSAFSVKCSDKNVFFFFLFFKNFYTTLSMSCRSDVQKFLDLESFYTNCRFTIKLHNVVCWNYIKIHIVVNENVQLSVSYYSYTKNI